jgi:hypothetical protein
MSPSVNPGPGRALLKRIVLNDRKAQCNLRASRLKSAALQMIGFRLYPVGPLALFGILSGCALLPQPEVMPPDQSPPADPGSMLERASTYAIDQAELEIHTFRAGWLSGLAHNHVLQTDAVGGRIHLTDPLERSEAWLTFRPWDLMLDDPAARAAAGPGFESSRTEADITATRKRMLGPRGFDSNHYPWVSVHVSWKDADHVALEIHLRGNSYSQVAPVNWSRDGNLIRLEADFELSHRALGLAPYSAFAGAIAVADPIRVQLRLSASPASSL